MNTTNINDRNKKLVIDLPNWFLNKQSNSISSLEIINGIVEAKRGDDVSLLNKYTIASIAQNYKIYLSSNNFKNIFITHDGFFHSIFFAKIFASILIDEGINVYFNFNNQPLNNATSVYVANESKINFDQIINFSHLLSKEYYRICFLNNNGSLLNHSISNEINKNISQTNYLIVNLNDINNVPTLEKNYINKYIDDVILNNQSPTNLNVLFSNVSKLNETILENYLNKTSIKYKINSSNNEKSYKVNTISRRSLIKSWGKNVDLLVNFLDIDTFEFWIKHKHRKKLLTYNDLAILYLYYKNQLQDHNISISEEENNNIVLSSFNTNDFIKSLSKEQHFKYKKCDDLMSSLAKEDKNNIWLATNGQNLFITKYNNSFCDDPIINIKLIIEMIAYYKKQNKSLYDALIEIYQKRDFYRFNEHNEQITFENVKKLFYKIENNTHICEQKIIRKRSFKTQTKMIEIILEDKTNIIFEYDKNKNNLKTTFSLWSNSKRNEVQNKNQIDEQLISLIMKEKKYRDFIENFKEQNFNVAKFNWKSVLKYTIFVALFALFFYFIFNFILGADKNLFEQIGNLLRSNEKNSYIIPLLTLSGILTISIDCWLTKRIIMLLDEKIKFKHLMISNIIGICVSTITPLVYGGESISYWYLRRKEAPRASIAAMFLIRSMLVQISIIVSSIILIPIGFVELIPDLFTNDSNSIVILILIICGVVVDSLGAIVISLLTFNSRIQTFICRNINKLLEWIPFIVSRDPFATGAKMKYEFSNINKAAKKIFDSPNIFINILIFLELLSYRLLMRFVDFGALYGIFSQMLIHNNFYGYISIMSGTALVRAVNALNFVTPGGIGVSDWAAKTIMIPLFVDGDDISNVNNFKTINVYQTVNRISFTISWVIISAFLLFTVYIGESRIDKYNIIKKTLTKEEIEYGNIKTKSTSYKQALIYWIIGIIGAIISWFLIYKFVILIN